MLLQNTWGQAKGDENTPPLPPGIAIHIEAHPESATIGDPIRLNLDITMPPGYRADVPRPVAKSGDFIITEFASGIVPSETGKPHESGRKVGSKTAAPVHFQAQITIAIYRTGRFFFPSIPINLITAEGREIAAQSPPVEIEIRSILTEKDAELKDLKKQAEIQEPVRWLLWILLAAAACILCAAAWYFRKRRPAPPEPLTPEQTLDLLDVAERDLRNLLGRGLPGDGMEKQFYIDLSDIVKRILEAGYDIHTAEQTTSEIMDVLNARPALNPGHRDLIESFLSRCDVVKFAKYIPDRTEQDAASQDALSVLAEARKAVGNRQSLVVSR